MNKKSHTTYFKASHVLILFLLLVLPLSMPATARAQLISAPPPPSDIILDYDISGIWGCKVIVWKRLGFYGGLRSSLRTPKGQKSKWSQDRAENVELSEFTGYSKKIYFGLNMGCAYSLSNNKVVVFGGLGYLRTRRFRQYFDEDLPGRGEWAENYYIPEGMKQNQQVGLQLGTYVRMEAVLIGLAYYTESKGFAISLGWPIGTGLSLGN